MYHGSQALKTSDYSPNLVCSIGQDKHEAERGSTVRRQIHLRSMSEA